MIILDQLPQKHHDTGLTLFFLVHPVSYRGPPAFEITLGSTSATVLPTISLLVLRILQLAIYGDAVFLFR